MRDTTQGDIAVDEKAILQTIESMTSAYVFSTTARRTFSVGVSSSSSMVRSRGRIVKCRIDSARDTVATAIRAHGRQAWFLPFDVADRVTARTALEGMLNERGTPYAVVVNAGITRDGLFGMLGDED